jgi:hypothetical protein
MNTDEHRFFRPQRIGIASIIAAIGGMVLSGCATNGGTQPSAPASSVQTSSGTTVGGYIDVGGSKTIH